MLLFSYNNLEFFIWSTDVQHLYKSQLQNYAQKRNLALPEYASEREGPPHNTRFKCRVTIDGQTFESPTFFSTLKEAENAAAKFALTSLSPNEVQQVIFYNIIIFILCIIIKFSI